MNPDEVKKILHKKGCLCYMPEYAESVAREICQLFEPKVDEELEETREIIETIIDAFVEPCISLYVREVHKKSVWDMWYQTENQIIKENIQERSND